MKHCCFDALTARRALASGFFAEDEYEEALREEEDELDEALDNKQLARLLVIGFLCLAAMGLVTYVLHVVRAATLLPPPGAACRRVRETDAGLGVWD